MSSVSRFLRQRQTGSTILGTASASDSVYVMIPGSGNYVGNYPNSPYTTTPGYVVSQTLVDVPANSYYRDMGKTIFCAVGTSATSGVAAGSTPGYFREVQIITPQGVANPISVSSFGVGFRSAAGGSGLPGQLPSATNIGDAGYNTFYIPIVVNGVVPTGAAGAAIAVSAAGIRVGEQL
jgi:hypothetical protein